MTGMTLVDPVCVYDGADLSHRYGVMLAMAMEYGDIAEAPSAIANAEVMRTCEALAHLSNELARRIRALGVESTRPSRVMRPSPAGAIWRRAAPLRTAR